MNNDKENQIRFRLKIISQIEPKEQAAQNAVEKVRDVLTQSEKQRESTSIRISRVFLGSQILKYTAAAVILIGIGFIAGRLAIPNQPEVNIAEIQTIVDKKCAEFAEKTLSASSTLMDKRMNEMLNVIEAARQKDRQWTAAAFEKIENDRRVDNTRMGNSLIALASRTSN